MVLLASSGSLDYPFLPSGMELARIYFPLTEETSVMIIFPAQPICFVRDKSARVGCLQKTQTPKNVTWFACDCDGS